MQILSIVKLATLGVVLSCLNGSDARRTGTPLKITDILDTFDLLPKTTEQRATTNWNVNCSTAINQLLTDATNMGTLFYALLNGLYLGQWGDYESCLVDAT